MISREANLRAIRDAGIELEVKVRELEQELEVSVENKASGIRYFVERSPYWEQVKIFQHMADAWLDGYRQATDAKADLNRWRP